MTFMQHCCPGLERKSSQDVTAPVSPCLGANPGLSTRSNYFIGECLREGINLVPALDRRVLSLPLVFLILTSIKIEFPVDQIRNSCFPMEQGTLHWRGGGNGLWGLPTTSGMDN